MSKETWFQFAQRVKPDDGQLFKDIYGNDCAFRVYSCAFVFRSVRDILYVRGLGKVLPCSLADAIEQVEREDNE